MNGVSYADGATAGSGKVIKFGQGNTFSKSGLLPSTNYYFTFFPFNSFTCADGPTYNTAGVQKNVTTTAGGTGIPTGYYDTVTTQTCAALKSVLKWRTTQGMTPRTYGALWTQYAVSDIKTGETATNMVTGAPYNYSTQNVIWDIYSDNPTGVDPYNFTPGTGSGGQQDQGSGGGSEGQFYNREHSVPLSWFSGSTGSNGPATDYLHIFPTDKKVNGTRANFIYGEVASASFTSLNGSKLGTSSVAGLTGTVFEPINEYKGDVARAFYIL